VHTFAVFCDEDGFVNQRGQMGVMVRALARCLDEYRKENGKAGMKLKRVRLLNDVEGSGAVVLTKAWKAKRVSVGVPHDDLEWVNDSARRFDVMGVTLENWRGERLGEVL
jgi:hypothetical protein